MLSAPHYLKRSGAPRVAGGFSLASFLALGGRK